MLKFGENLGKSLRAPALIELVGDVGTGKTTITRGIAKGLGISEPVTSPSFTIAKRYAFPLADGKTGTLVHYDFYRLDDPGIMSEDLEESLSDQNTITIIEWGNSVENLLPKDHQIIHINYLEDGSREIIS